MELKTAKCPECGADLQIPEGKDVITCEYCGANVVVKDLLGTSAPIQNYMSLAASALQGGSFKEAYDYYNKVLETDSTNSDAWFGKAVSAGRMTHVNDVRFDEMVVLFGNAIKYTSQDKQGDVKKKAAVEIDKAVMNVVTNIRGGGEFLINPREGGGYSVSIGNILSDAKRLADESIRALETAHEWMPENVEITNDLDNLKKHIGKVGAISGIPNLNLMGQSVQSAQNAIPTRRRPFRFVHFIFMVIILIGGYVVIKNYVLKEKTLGNLIKETVNTEHKKPVYTIAGITSQNGSACVSVYTEVTSDEDLLDINQEVVNKYYSKYKQIYVNFYSDKTSAARNGNLQFKHQNDWIASNSGPINLKATMEYNANDQTSKYYRYVNGNIVSITPKNN